ncbi:MAG: acyl carrier protein [Dehalococcoidia bacterium]
MSDKSSDGVRAFVRLEVSRLAGDGVEPGAIADDMPLFDIDDRMLEGLGLDSLCALELVVSLEDQYGIHFDGDIDFKELATVKGIAAHVSRLLHASAMTAR